MACSRFVAAIFAAEQRALWPNPQRDAKARRWSRWSPYTIAIVVLAWIVYWIRPCTWRRAPSHLRAFVRVSFRQLVRPWRKKR